MNQKEERGKKSWNKPEMVVLVRNNPEEAVLAGCKVSDIGGGNDGPQTAVYGCLMTSFSCAVACSGVTAS